jgi:hypothetical protein
MHSGTRVTTVASAGTASTVVTEPAAISGSLQFDSEMTIQQDAVRTTAQYVLTATATPRSIYEQTPTPAGTVHSQYCAGSEHRSRRKGCDSAAQDEGPD